MKNNVDPREIHQFDTLSSHWWNPEGELKSLHDINPLRLTYINDKAKWVDKKVIDIGCGGGILAESMAQLGAKVTAIDMSETAIDAAKQHQLESGTDVEYSVSTAEDLANTCPGHFDVLTCMELLEHVPDPVSVIKSCAKLLKPSGLAFFSTLNRNMKSYLFAIIGAEYVLKLLPQHTHDFAKFIKPSELEHWGRQEGLHLEDFTGMSYNPLNKKYKLTEDLSVNYLAYFKKNL